MTDKQRLLPETIWLQCDGTFDYKDEVTWCWHEIESDNGNTQYTRTDTVSQQLEAAEKMAKALEPFAASLDRASDVIKDDANHDIAHIVRATTFWLSYNDFLRAQHALQEYRKVVDE